jgi:probable selenium-dependent hydroxylase accessory protein YqeC
VDSDKKIGDSVFLPHIPFITGDVISLVGSGGKTTLMYQLARELAQRGKRVITTTTTKIFPPRPYESPRLIVSEGEEVLIHRTRELLKKETLVTLAKGFIGPKLEGLSPALIDKIREYGIGDIILNEADGARHCSLKAPNETEPIIPSSTTWTLPVVGLDGVGKINTEEYVFRPDYFSRLTGIKEGAEITPEAVAKAILHPDGITRGSPEKARIVLILNKGEFDGCLNAGMEIAQSIMKARKKSIAKVLITSLTPTPRVMMVLNLDSAPQSCCFDSCGGTI